MGPSLRLGWAGLRRPVWALLKGEPCWAQELPRSARSPPKSHPLFSCPQGPAEGTGGSRGWDTGQLLGQDVCAGGTLPGLQGFLAPCGVQVTGPRPLSLLTWAAEAPSSLRPVLQGAASGTLACSWGPPRRAQSCALLILYPLFRGAAGKPCPCVGSRLPGLRALAPALLPRGLSWWLCLASGLRQAAGLAPGPEAPSLDGAAPGSSSSAGCRGPWGPSSL